MLVRCLLPIGPGSVTGSEQGENWVVCEATTLGSEIASALSGKRSTASAKLCVKVCYAQSKLQLTCNLAGAAAAAHLLVTSQPSQRVLVQRIHLRGTDAVKLNDQPASALSEASSSPHGLSSADPIFEVAAGPEGGRDLSLAEFLGELGGEVLALPLLGALLLSAFQSPDSPMFPFQAAELLVEQSVAGFPPVAQQNGVWGGRGSGKTAEAEQVLHRLLPDLVIQSLGSEVDVTHHVQKAGVRHHVQKAGVRPAAPCTSAMLSLLNLTHTNA